MRKSRLRRLTMAALCGAVAFVLMYFSISIPFLSLFAEFEFSSLAELIGGFVLGPVGAMEIIVVKILLKIAFKGSLSMLTGEVQALLLSMSYVLPAVLYYRRHRTKKGAVIGLALGSVLSVMMAVFTNIYLIFPAYISLYGMNWDGIIEMCSAVNPRITSIPTFIAFSIVPFNVISRMVISVITFFVYKKISVPIKKFVQ